LLFRVVFLVLFFVAIPALTVYLDTPSAVDCPTAPTTPADRRTNKKKLTVSSFNAEWLFLEPGGAGNCPGTGCPWKDTKQAQEHLTVIANVLREIDADIVSLVEVQNCNVLKKLNDELKDLKYLPYMISGTDTATGQNVGILTRIDPSVNMQRTANRIEYPVKNSSCDASSTGSSGVSKHYFTKFNVGGLSKPLGLIGLHFLAFPDRQDRCVEREAQATVIRDLGRSLGDTHLIVLGDVNDFDREIKDAAGSVAISNVLDILKDGAKLHNVAANIINVSQRYSCWWDANGNCKVDPKELTMIDHLLVSTGLRAQVASASFYHGYQASCNTLNSDHWPVVVQLNTP